MSVDKKQLKDALLKTLAEKGDYTTILSHLSSEEKEEKDSQFKELIRPMSAVADILVSNATGAFTEPLNKRIDDSKEELRAQFAKELADNKEELAEAIAEAFSGRNSEFTAEILQNLNESQNKLSKTLTDLTAELVADKATEMLTDLGEQARLTPAEIDDIIEQAALSVESQIQGIIGDYINEFKISVAQISDFKENVEKLLPQIDFSKMSIDWSQVRNAPSQGGTNTNIVRQLIAEALAGFSTASVSDEAYGGTWDGVTDAAPSKNAVYDKIQALSLGSGTGDVVGPASAVNNRVVFFDGTTGKLIKDSGLTISGSNTGDQTTIVGITGTKAQYDTSVTDGNFLYVGDVTTNATHTGDATGATALTLATVNSNVGSFGLTASVAQFTVNAKGLITAAANVAISITSAAVTDFASTVRATVLTGISFATSTAVTAADSVLVAIGKLQKQNTDQDTAIALNTAKVTNATHTGEVTGSGALTVDKTAITNKTNVTAAVGDSVLISDVSDTDNLKKVTVQSIIDLASGGGNTFNDIYIDQSGGTSDTYGSLTGTINGSNALFTVSQAVYATGTLKVWLNGQLMTQGTGEDFVETTPASGTFTFNTAPATGSLITAEYQKVVTNSSTILTTANISDTAYAGTWDGVTTIAPSKNAIYDKIETLTTGSASATDNAIARYDSTTGKLIQNSAATVSDDGIIRSATNSGANVVSVPLVNWVMLTADYTLSNVATEQKLFNTTTNGTLNLPSGIYEFESFIYLTGMSITSGNGAFDPVGAGTAVADRFGYDVVGIDNANAITAAAATTGSGSVTQETASNMVAGTTAAVMRAKIEGLFRVSTGGTIIPSITLTTASAAVVKAGSYFKIAKIGESSETSVGAWT